jgi:hypothetical protein
MEEDFKIKFGKSQNLLSYISLTSSLLIIIIFFAFTNLRSLTYIYILFIGISEIIGNLPFCLKYIFNDSFFISCIAFSDSFTMLSLLSYSYLISNYLKTNEQRVLKKKCAYIIFTIIISTIYCGLINLLGVELKNIRIIYFEKEEKKKSIKNFHLIINLFISFFNLFLIYSTVNYIRIQAKNDIKNAQKILSVCRNLYNYPIIGCLGWLFSSIYFFFELFTNNHNIHIFRIRNCFSVFTIIFFHLRGTLIFYEFIRSPKVFKNMIFTINHITYWLKSKQRKMSIQLN